MSEATRGQMTHLDADVLAEFRAGLIGGRRGGRIAGHLAGCERCTALSGQLADVSALLAAVPAPAMPQSVASRLDTVLAAEAAKDIYPERTRGAPARSQKTGGRGFRLIAVRVLAPVAAVLLAAVGYGLSRIGGGPGNQPAAGSAAAPAARSPETPATATIHQGMSPARIAQSVFSVVTSSIDYQPATISKQLAGQLHATPAASAVKPATGPMRDCVRQVTGGAQPRFVETARFKGRPATIIVVSRSSGDMAWVAGPGCSAGNGHVLYTTTLPPGI